MSSVASSRSSSSFRDPAGHIIVEGGLVKRVITAAGKDDYQLLMGCGLYQTLVDRSLMVSHQEERNPAAADADAWKVLLPAQVPHVSYAYEWCFEQIKDAALLTLEAQKLALERGMSLKDASAFNVQFLGPSPVFIDTLSFERRPPGPWVAYDQFCRHFLAPLLLMAHVSIRFNRYLQASLDGFPLDLASDLLPRRTYLQLGPLLHVHLHARSQKRHQGRRRIGAGRNGFELSDRRALALIESLAEAVSHLRAPQPASAWIDYYRDAAHYPPEAEALKKEAVSTIIRRLSPSLVYDLGGNTGAYARLATGQGIRCICYDSDPYCVNQNYLQSKREGDRQMLPLLMDLANPSPSCGFELRERQDIFERSRPDLVLALALVHHLRITANIPLTNIARFLARLSPRLLIEFVPREDPMTQVLLQGRRSELMDYEESSFYRAFDSYFELEERTVISGTGRTLCLFRRLR